MSANPNTANLNDSPNASLVSPGPAALALPAAGVGAASSPPLQEMSFKVQDSTATAGSRTHVMLDAKKQKVPFVFPNDHEFIDVPYRYALLFARIPEFRVLDQAGRQIRAVDTRRNYTGIQMQANELIARYDELKRDALLVRANKAGGNFKPAASSAELIAFLVDMGGMQILSEGDELEEEEDDQPAPGKGKGGRDGRVVDVRRPADGSIAENEVDFELA